MLVGVSTWYAESGGGGFSPTEIPGLMGWWDASDASTIQQTGGSVSQWNDKSGNGNHATQSTGASQPLTGTRMINGKNALECSSSTVMNVPGNNYVGVGVGVTVISVCSKNNDNANNRLINGNANGLEFMFRSNAFIALSRAGSFGLVGTAAIANNTPVIIQGDISPSNYNIRVNGADYATRTSGSGDIPAQPIFILNQFDGIVGDQLVYRRPLAANELAQLVGYLKAKWSIS